MAIFHLSVKTFSRSKGQSATASVAYRAGAKIECEREGRTHDYTKKGGVLHSEIFLPTGAPSWAHDRQQLWNEVERAEKRKNSTVAREFEVALPYELSEKQRIGLVQNFAKQIVNRHGCAVDAHLHDDGKRTVKANHHAHIMLTTRKLEKDGFTSKTRELDQKRSGEIIYWREQWAKTVNEYLRDNGIEDYIDHRSLKEQGLEREPTIKMGASASALERKGIKTERGDYNRAVTAYNPDKINKHLTVQFKQAEELHNKLKFIKRRLPEVKRDIADKQPKLYQVLDDMGIPTAPIERDIENERTAKQYSTRLDRPQSSTCYKDERKRGLQTVSSSTGNELGQAHTSPVKRPNIENEKFTEQPRKLEVAELAIARYEKMLELIESKFEKSALEPLRSKLSKLQSSYDTARKPFFTRRNKWISKRMEDRTELRQLERQISNKQTTNKGKFKQEAKDWIATHKPATQEEYQQAKHLIKEHRKLSKGQVQDMRINIVRNSNIDIDR